MTDSEAVDAARHGERVAGQFSLHAAALPTDEMLKVCPGWNHNWRVLFCDGDTDVVECRRCGTQQLARCNFDEDFA